MGVSLVLTNGEVRTMWAKKKRIAANFLLCGKTVVGEKWLMPIKKIKTMVEPTPMTRVKNKTKTARRGNNMHSTTGF